MEKNKNLLNLKLAVGPKLWVKLLAFSYYLLSFSKNGKSHYQ